MAKNGADAGGAPVAFISGGAGNLGRAVSRAFVEAGWRISVALHHGDAKDALAPLAAAHPGAVSTCLLDLTTARGTEAAVRQTVEWGGRIDCVAHLMGGYAGGRTIAEADPDEWERMLALNLTSAWNLTRAAIPRMLEKGGGTLVFVSSRAARERRAKVAAYAVSKAGLLVLAAAIAEEYGERGIRASCVLPGTIDTPANRRAMPDADHARWTAPDEIARAILFLAGPESSAVNGAAVPVYGRS